MSIRDSSEAAPRPVQVPALRLPSLRAFHRPAQPDRHPCGLLDVAGAPLRTVGLGRAAGRFGSPLLGRLPAATPRGGVGHPALVPLLLRVPPPEAAPVASQRPLAARPPAGLLLRAPREPLQSGGLLHS